MVEELKGKNKRCGDISIKEDSHPLGRLDTN
jgi:hypothetical protein